MLEQEMEEIKIKKDDDKQILKNQFFDFKSLNFKFLKIYILKILKM